jgi:hypothetical protein
MQKLSKSFWELKKLSVFIKNKTQGDAEQYTNSKKKIHATYAWPPGINYFSTFVCFHLKNYHKTLQAIRGN